MTDPTNNRLPVELPITTVTVQEDRALVRREGRVRLAPGRNRLAIEGVSPVIVDKSLAVVAIDGASEVHSAKVIRERVIEPSQGPKAQAQLDERLRQCRATLAQTCRELDGLVAERATVEALVQTQLEELAEDASFGRLDVDAARSALATWHDRLDALAVQTGALGRTAAELERQRQDLEAMRLATKTLAAYAKATLQLDVHHDASEPAEVTVRAEYLVAGALWRPWHRAQLIQPGPDGEDRVRFECDGCVWQATGEDWVDAAIVLSTERPSLGIKPPNLATDALTLRRRSETIDVQTRQETIRHASLDDEDTPAETAAETEQVPGIDDGGDLQRLQGAGPATIPADGRPHRVPLFAFETPATVDLRCTAELATSVILRSEQHNKGTHPLLAGPVDLIRNSGLVGRTSILYVAPGERFELGWGPDPALRVHRTVEFLDPTRKALRSWTTTPRRVTVKLSNLEATPKDVIVRERITVSEIDKVKVTLDSAEPSASADDNGFVEWAVRLQGLGRNTVELLWSVSKHDDVRGG